MVLSVSNITNDSTITYFTCKIGEERINTKNESMVANSGNDALPVHIYK